ncbi:hypothetical protein [Bacillus litorisediminis]|uniref:hypothetical protein n=1 Tax=Bacillus litorisediminis TaxID=2922713 RepID=UPI001FB033D8|nr:hypothetical protein [Bacillus litorisediminis]
MKDFKEQLNVIQETLFPEGHIESFRVEKPEYNTVEEFIHYIAKNWEEDSDYRKVYGNRDSADFTLANSVLHYVNYFKSDFNLDSYLKRNLEM